MKLALKKEVMTVEAHIPLRNDETQKFAEVAKQLKDNTLLSLPLCKDGKHCRNRLRVLFEKWIFLRAIAVTISGGEKIFGE